MAMVGAGWALDLESVYLGVNDQEGAVTVILPQEFRNLESHEVVLLHYGLYDMCECGMYVQLDFESVSNSLADAGDMRISTDGWAALQVGEKKGVVSPSAMLRAN